MNALLFTLAALAVLILAMGGQWLWLHRRHVARMDAMRAKHLRYKLRAEEMLSSSKLQIASLKHQLTGARLVAARTERQFPKTIVQQVTPKTMAKDSLLMMLDDDSRPMSYASGFANTQTH